MATSQIDRDLIRDLIAHHRAADPDMAEANVAEVFVARFFEALGWDTRDPLVWNRQAFVRGAGFADAALQIGGEPVLFVEVKRFKGVVRRQAEVTVEQTLYGDAPILSQAEREALNIDRTPEEKQAMRYARRAGIRWAVLTNFERLLLFNADEERVVLAFDTPDAYLARLDDLALLAPAETRAQFHSRIQWYADLQKKPEIDEDFYRFLSEWRIELAQQIYDHNWRGEVLPVGGEKTYAHLAEPPLTAAPGMGEPPRHLLQTSSGELDLDRLRRAVQRTLDRLILLRYADDVGFLAQHNLLESQLIAFMQRQLYVNEYELQQDLNRLYWAFYRQHDTSIFTPGALCERLRIPNQTLIDLIQAINAISFRKFSGDILGNTYESYLGQRLVLEEDDKGAETIRVESDRALRKESGIYYTPSYIVRYIVDHTLGRWLYGTANGRPDGEPLPGVAPLPGGASKSIADLAGLRLVDPAMGSGSFLIYAFEVLAEFYERENARIEAKNAARWNAWSEQAMKEGMFGQDNDVPELEQPARDYVGRILQEHLYGVDSDPEAAEIASVNLILRAFDRLRGERERQKLPLVLGQNLKVGNSLIGGVTGPEDLAPFEAERRQLIARREDLRDLTGDTARAQKQAEIAEIAAPVNAALNASLAEHFDVDEIGAKRPFNWEIEFPEVFAPDAPEETQGFTFVIGNPPWGRTTLDKKEKKFFKEISKVDTRHPDTYTLFIEFGVNRVAKGGYCGYIVPDTLLLKNYPMTRKLMLDAGENEILRHAGMGFGEVNLDTTIFTLQKCDDGVSDDHLVLAGTESDLSDVYAIPQSLFLSLPDYRFNIYLTPDRLKLYEKLRRDFPRFSEFTETHEGIHTGNIRDKLFVDSRRNEYSKPLIFGREEIDRYFLNWGGRFVQYNPDLIDRDAGEYASLREERIFLVTKLFIRRTGDRILATLDEHQFYTSNNLFCLLLKDEGANYDLRYVLALLNSRLMTTAFRLEVPRVDRLFAELKITHIDDFPFPAIDFSDPAQVAAHDALVALAQRMLDLNATHQAVTDAFAEAVRGYERTATTLSHFLTEQHDVIARRPLLDANDEGEVSAIAVAERERDGCLVISVQVDEVWRDVVRLEIAHEDVRLYLLLALRAFLYEHRRKYVWSRGKILRGVLDALDVPRLASATTETHQRRVAQVLDDARRLLPGELPHHNVGLDHAQAPLHLSALESELSAADAEIDRRVYALYGLTDEEIAVVAGE